MILVEYQIHTIEAIGLDRSRTMGEIAHDLRITVGTLTTAITKLIKKGYVERKRIEEDRRVVLFYKYLLDSIITNYWKLLYFSSKKVFNFSSDFDKTCSSSYEKLLSIAHIISS